MITQEDIDNHSKEGGAWFIVNGKVYDAQSLAVQAPCGDKKLLSYAGKDATEAFNAAGHSDFVHEMARDYLVGDYSEVRTYTGVIWD